MLKSTNEDIKAYLPGSPEKKSLKTELEKLENQHFDIPVIINGQDLNLPIIKSGQTSFKKEIIFLFAGYNKPKDLIDYYSIKDKVYLKIKNTDFEEIFDVSSIKSVLEDTVLQCFAKSLYY